MKLTEFQIKKIYKLDCYKKIILFFPTIFLAKKILKIFLKKCRDIIKDTFIEKLIFIILYILAKYGIVNSNKQVNIVELNKKIKNLYKNEFDYLNFKKKEEIPVVVSLTTFPQRIKEVKYVLLSLIEQNVRPQKIILWLANEQFPNKEYINSEFKIFYKFGIEIKYTNDIKSYKKIIPTLHIYKNKIIVIADDDNFYHKNWLDTLYKSYLAHKDEKVAICHRMHKIVIENNKILPYIKWQHLSPNLYPSPLNFATGVGGILFPPNCFYKDIMSESIFMRLSKFGDDIWLWAMLILNGYCYITASNEKFQIKSINLLREKNIFRKSLTLCNININNNKNDEQLKNVIEFYNLNKILINYEKNIILY